MKKIKVLSNLFVIFTILVISACSQNNEVSNNQNSDNKSASENIGEPTQGGDLVIAYDSDVSNFDPILGNSGNDHALLYPVYDTLINYNSNLEPEPGLSESWETPDNTTIILHLREGVTFHDGTPFDAEAVKFNLERVNSEESNVSDVASIDSIEVIDTYTVKLNLKHPDSSIILALSDRSGMMISPTAVETLGEDFAQNPVGAGPFKMVDWVRNGEIKYEAYQNYWQEGQPYLDSITAKIMPDENTRLNALKSGQINFYWNVSANNTQVLKNDPNLVLNSTMRVYFYNIYLNTKIAPFDKKEVRQALQYAINRESIVEAFTLGEGEPAYQAFPKNYWPHKEDIKINYDPAKSNELLKSVGLESVSFDMAVVNITEWQRIGEAIKAQVKEAGFEINLKTMELNKSNSMYFNEKQIAANLTAWTGRPDPQQTINLLIGGNGFYNVGGETSPEKEELISKAAASNNLEERAQLYGEINKIAILDEAMTIPLMFTPIVAAMSQEVKGFEGTLLGKPKISFLWLDE